MKYPKSTTIVAAALMQAACMTAPPASNPPSIGSGGNPPVVATNIMAKTAGNIEWNDKVWTPPVNSAGGPDLASVEAQLDISGCIQAPAPKGQFYAPCRVTARGHVVSVTSQPISAPTLRGASQSTVMARFPGNLVPSMVYSARYVVDAPDTSPPQPLLVDVKLGTAFQQNPDKVNSLAIPIPDGSGLVSLNAEGHGSLDWQIGVVSKACDD